MIGLAILSEPIILVLLGEKWLFASELLFWLSLSYIFTPFSVLNLNVLNAIGRSDLFMKVDFSKAPIIILTMIITFPISLKAVAIGNAITALFYFYVNAFIIGRLFNFGGTKQLLISWRYIVSSFIMGFVLFFLIVVLKTKNIPYSLSILFFLILIGAIIYLALLFLLKDSILKQYWTLLKNKISNIKGIHKL
jgi:O-antigen/teichoic acid export membrane protein